MITDVIRKGSYYQTLNDAGKKISEKHESHLGFFKNAVGSSMIFIKGSYVATYDVMFKKISERHI